MSEGLLFNVAVVIFIILSRPPIQEGPCENMQKYWLTARKTNPVQEKVWLDKTDRPDFTLIVLTGPLNSNSSALHFRSLI